MYCHRPEADAEGHDDEDDDEEGEDPAHHCSHHRACLGALGLCNIIVSMIMYIQNALISARPERSHILA